MPASQYTVDALVETVRDMTFISADSRDWPTDKIVRLLNRGLDNYLTPFIVAANEEFFITYVDVPIVSGQVAYPLPSGCHAQNIRILQLLDNNGMPMRVLPQKELDVALNPFTVFGVTSGLGTPSCFYIEGNQFYPQPIATASGVQAFRIHYAARPSQLVRAYDELGQYAEAWEYMLTSQVDPVTGLFSIINYTGAESGGPVAVFGPDSPFVGAGDITYLCDIIMAIPPYDIVGQTELLNDQVAGVANPLTILTAVNPTAAANDLRWQAGQPFWVALAGTAPVCTSTTQELSFGLLAQWSVCRILESKADEAGFGMSLANLKALEERAKEMLRRRVLGPGKRAFANPYSGKGGRGIVAFYT